MGIYRTTEKREACADMELSICNKQEGIQGMQDTVECIHMFLLFF